MQIGVVGVNHKDTPIEIREKFNFSESQKIEGSSILQKDIDEVLILSTCNRSEIYYASADDQAEETIKDFYSRYFSYPKAGDYLFSLKGSEAVDHIYKVAAGLDSIVIGEDQILAQIKEAIEFSMELKFSKKFLNRLFQSALASGKKIRTHTKISSIPLSASYIGIKILRDALGTLEDKSALVIGAGEMSELSIRYLDDQDLSHIYVTNRTDGRLDDLFEKFQSLEKISYSDRYAYMKEVDIVITATAAVHRILEYEDFPSIAKDLYILDLGLPRDVDEKIGSLDGVHIYSLDDLEEKSSQNEKKRKDLSLKAHQILKEDVKDYMDWLYASEVDPILSSLNDKKHEIEKDAISYLNRKLELSSREKKITQEVISYVLNRITREAVLTVKDNAQDQAYQEKMAELFDLEI